MFKKAFVVSLVLAMCVAVATMALAQDVKVTNATKKASALFFPKIEVGPERDTIIMISNDYFTQVWVKCYWMNYWQEIQDFQFPLTPNQPVWFRASDGQGTGIWDDVSNPITVPPFFGGDSRGELKCWAVNAAGTRQISFNHLYGNAVIVDFVDGTAFEYNAWGFAAVGVNRGAAVGTGGNLALTGLAKGYDACPAYVTANFFSAGAELVWDEGPQILGVMGTELTVTPCKQDLRQDRTPTCSKLKFDIWNANETKYTGAYACFKCWFEDWLGETLIPDDTTGTDGWANPFKKYGFEKFEWETLHTINGRFRTTGIASDVCPNTTAFGTCTGGQVDTPVVAVISTQVDINGLLAEFGTNVHTAGTDGSGFVLWDIQWDHPEAAAN